MGAAEYDLDLERELTRDKAIGEAYDLDSYTAWRCKTPEEAASGSRW